MKLPKNNEIRTVEIPSDMMLRTGLIGKNNIFHLEHSLPMFIMYCILELLRGITIPQAQAMMNREVLPDGYFNS